MLTEEIVFGPSMKVEGLNLCLSMFMGSKEETAEWKNAKKNLITILIMLQK
jgi:hypothetical protein